MADYFAVSTAARDIPGLSANDLRLCAGLPERTTKGADGREFWSYERSSTASTGTISFAGLGINLAGGQECRATFELSDGRVSRMAFTRATSQPACAPLVATCASMAQGLQQGLHQGLQMSPDPEPAPTEERRPDG